MSPRQSAPFSLEYIVLGFLEHRPIHGYDLYKKINSFEGISLVWEVKQSQLYALLEKLKSDGLLDSNLVQGESYPSRKEFQITSVGRQAFYAWRISPVNHAREMRQEFLAKFYFAYHSGMETALELVEEQKDTCVEWLTSNQISYLQLSPDQHYERVVYQFRISQIEAMLEWLDTCRNEIQFSRRKSDVA
jgi:PadR family transcriptional regulator, regulatory protein AphA